MKRLVLLYFLVCAGIAAVEAENLLANPGFEIGSAGGVCPDGWWKYGNCGQENWAGRSGSNGMAFWSWDNGAYGGFGQDLSGVFREGDVVEFSIWALAEPNFRSSQAETWLKIEYHAPAGQGAAADGLITAYVCSVYQDLVAHPDQWRWCSLVTTTPAGVGSLKIIVGGGGFTNNGGAQAVKWDDALVRLIGSADVSNAQHSVDTHVIGDTALFRWPSSTERYYQVWAATNLAGPWIHLRGVVLGADGTLQWTDALNHWSGESIYYKVISRPITMPDDADGDGYDDVYELRNGRDPCVAEDDPQPGGTNSAPVIHAVRVSSPANFHNSAPIELAVDASDSDGDSLMYRACDASGCGTWQAEFGISYPIAGKVGECVVTVEVQDEWGGAQTQQVTFLVFRAPPVPFSM